MRKIINDELPVIIPEERRMTTGKKIGLVAFVISEILVVFTLIVITIGFLTDHEIEKGILSNLLLFQGAVFTVVWGAKASSNFAVKKERSKP
jgi:hypothetical protein